MRSKRCKFLGHAVMLVSFSVLGTSALAQDPSSVSETVDKQCDLRRVTELLQQLQSQVQELSVELKNVRAAQASTVSELVELRRKLADSNSQINQTATAPIPAKAGNEGAPIASLRELQIQPRRLPLSRRQPHLQERNPRFRNTPRMSSRLIKKICNS